jgi:hypothetical protein
VLYTQTTLTPCTLNALRRHSHNWFSAAAPSDTFVDFDPGIAAISVNKAAVDFGGLTVDGDQEYLVTWVCGHMNDRALACRVFWTEVGPRHVP